MRPSVPDVHITDPQDAELATYRAVAPQSVFGLIGGLLAPLALVDTMLWALPLVGAFFSWWALRRIRNNPTAMSGRKMAMAGLALSLIFLIAAPTDLLVHRRLMADEARRFSALWFKYLTEEEPQKAHQLTTAQQTRRPLDDGLWTYYRTPRVRGDLENYVKTPLIRTMLALGPKARVRFYETAGQSRDSENDLVEQVYVVTYEEDNERKSFFVLVRMGRRKLAAGGAEWRILGAEGGIRPQGW
jgi:hypothetical protein